ncbi:baculoviral IAP repeat-containing protein 6 isoform X2 [Nematostella vectensis]|uniref:baculoviral IAP repeat-containing protein 6 isoform X2 n=1 Tax=Nematostella vectensis TaxID=45351 RepID=UPI002076F5EF|nr:baculoviral IAP repeat-containing protein 6 isoform X2 [Nematostella vectensis]
MAAEEWFLQEEGCLQFNGRPTSISYTPTSHCFVATLEDGSVEVLDVSSGRTLKRTSLEGNAYQETGILECRFCTGVEKLLVTDGKTVGLRKDLNGVLLLDSILQAPVAEDSESPVLLELSLSDAKNLYSGIEVCIPSAVPPVLDVMEKLKQQLKSELEKYQSSAQHLPQKTKEDFPVKPLPVKQHGAPSDATSASSDDSDKTTKWITCKISLAAGALLCAFDGMVVHLHKSYKTSAALPIASAMLARVMSLTGTSVLEKKGQPVYKQLMFVEASRRQTFSSWPHLDYKWAYPEAMAQAGFYHQPSCTGDDRAMCFTCSVCLVCWEPTDEPWSEHERHSAECPYVKGERTENVPMSVSLATTPAKSHSKDNIGKITCVGESSCPCLIVTCTDNGHVVVWDLSDQLKPYSQFIVNKTPVVEKEKEIEITVPAPIQAWPKTEQNKASETILPTLLNEQWNSHTTELVDAVISGMERSQAPAPVIVESAEGEGHYVEESREGVVEEPSDSGREIQEVEMEFSEVIHPAKEITSLTLVCQPNQDHQHFKCLHNTGHRPVVIAGVTPKHNPKQAENIPYIAIFDASAETDSRSNYKGDSKLKSDAKSSPTLGSHDDLYSILSSEDELDQEIMPALPDVIQSSTLKKLAAAIIGEKEEDTVEVKNGNIIQTVQLPDKLRTSNYNKIVEMLPSSDGCHLLVVVHVFEMKGQWTEEHGSSKCSNVDDSTEQRTEEKWTNCSCIPGETLSCLLLLYKLEWSSDGHIRMSSPLAIKELQAMESLQNVIALPVENSETIPHLFPIYATSESSTDVSVNVRFAGIAKDGGIIIISGQSLDVLTRFSPEGERFNSFVYCPGIDCLCCSTVHGSLRFLSLMHKEDVVDGEATGSHASASTPESSLESLGLRDNITAEALSSLLKMTEFENLVPRFTAIVPPCWSEVQQEQQQRRHPQHLHQQSLGDATLHTRTWKLQPEARSNMTGEQVFEILLPKQCHVGHVDIKFSFQSSSSSSCNGMQVYLLKPWSLKSWQQDYTSESTTNITPDGKAALLATARERGNILCGPVELESGSSSRVVLTCPELVKSRHRILLLVFESTEPQVHLDDISVTVRRFKHKPAHLKQYGVLLEDPGFHHKLLEIICGYRASICVETAEIRRLALDLLCWTAGICVYTRRDSLTKQVQANLHDLISSCFLGSGRTMAHKCCLLLLLCARQAHWSSMQTYSNSETSFKSSLLRVILQILPDLTSAVSAGSLQWLFCLLTGYAAQADITKTSQVCQELLTGLSTRFVSLVNPLHSVLHARHELYGSPLDPDLFDLAAPPPAEPPAPPSTSPFRVITTSTQILAGGGGMRQQDESSVAAKNNGSSTTSNSAGLQDLEAPMTNPHYMGLLIANHGLLEVEPLHYACSSTSDGARVERVETPPIIPAVPGSLSTSTAQSAAAVHPLDFKSSSSQNPDMDLLALAKLQKHKKELEKHKQELEELAVWSLIPKVLNKFEITPDTKLIALNQDPYTESSSPWGAPYVAPFMGVGQNPSPAHLPGDSVNLSMEKKLANRRAAANKGSLSPAQVHCHLSQLPTQQVLIIERLHSGARHHVILDFGSVVELTDIIVPQCTDLSSLSIDVWTEGEEMDAQRIAIVSDIGSCDCVLKDLLPSPVCQYLKLTVVGRPRSNAKVKMKIGEFYGRPVTPRQSDVLGEPKGQRLELLSNLYEEVYCHYSLACHHLTTLLQDVVEPTKVQKVYQQCRNLQLQLNFIQKAVDRVRGTTPRDDTDSFDKLRVICTHLADTLVALTAIRPPDKGFLVTTTPPNINYQRLPVLLPEVCEVLFRNLCIHANPTLRLRVAALLLHASGEQSWWGSFIAKIMMEFFSTSQQSVFPQEKVFMVLAVLAQHSPDVTSTVESLLTLLDNVLSKSGSRKMSGIDTRYVDFSLVGWILLLFAHVLDTCNGGNGSSDSSGRSSDKWDFIMPPPSIQTTPQTSSLTGYRQQRHKLRRQIVLHEKQLQELQKQQKKVMEVEGMQPSDVHHFQQAYLKSKFTSQALKHIKDLVKLRRQESEPSSSKDKCSTSKSGNSGATDSTPATVQIVLPHSVTVPTLKKMMQLLINLDSLCSVGFFLTMCKVISHLARISQPPVVITDVLDTEEVETVLLCCVTGWGGPWVRHSLITLLEDLMHGGSVIQETADHTKEIEAQHKASDTEQDNSELVIEQDTMDTKIQEQAAVQEEWTMEVVPGEELKWLGENEFFDTPQQTQGETVTTLFKFPPKPVPANATPLDPPPVSPLLKLSSAIDARLELGVEMEAESDLKTLQITQADAILKGMSTQPQAPKPYKIPKTKTTPSLSSVATMFSTCFDKLFHRCRDTNIDLSSLLEVWLRLSNCLSRNTTLTPSLSVTLSDTSVADLLYSLVRQGTTLQTLYLAFEVLRELLEKTSSGEDSDAPLLANIISNPDLLKVLKNTFLESSPRDYGAAVGVGTSGTGIKQVEVFLSSLATSVDKQQDIVLSSKLHNLLLNILCDLAAEKIESSGKPVQLKPILRVLIKHPPPCTQYLDHTLLLRLVNLAMQLSLQHLQQCEDITLTASNHYHETPRLTMTSTSQFLEGKSVSGPWIVHSTWLTKLLSLAIMLIRLPRTEVDGKDEGSQKDLSSLRQDQQGPSGQDESRLKGADQEGIHVLEVASDSLYKTLQALAKAVEDETQDNEGSSLTQKDKGASSPSTPDTSGEETSPSSGDAESDGTLEKEEFPGHDSQGKGEKEDANDVEVQWNDGSGQKSTDRQEKPIAGGKTKPSPSGSIKTDLPKSELPEIIIKDEKICLNLLCCLNLSNSNNIGVLLTGASMVNTKSDTDEVIVSGDPVSVEDGILQIASVIQSQLSDKNPLITTVIRFLGGELSEGREGGETKLREGRSRAPEPIVELSEPFLWFLFTLLKTEEQVAAFNERGGFEVLFSNLLASHTVELNQDVQELIPVMRQLAKRTDAGSNSSAKPLLAAIWEAEKDKGLVNYAPFGTISCSRPTSHAPDALLKATAPHRRARSAAWSYHFYPGELWCDLNIHLPTPVLMHEVHIQPHTAGLTTCPSYVALDYSVDGAVMVPASKPVMTSGLSVIKLQFQQPQVAQNVCVRCRRPRDSETLGLSQIKVWGSTLYGPPDDGSLTGDPLEQMTCLNWVRLLHHCLRHTSPAAMATLTSLSQLREVFSVCIDMLSSSKSDLFTGCQEAVLLRLALHCSSLDELLLTSLLADPEQASRGWHVSSSSVQLIYELGCISDGTAPKRMKIFADWIRSLTSNSDLPSTTTHALTGQIQALAAVLYLAAESQQSDVVMSEIRETHFRALFTWSQFVSRQETLKQAIDYLIGSLCHVCPVYFQLLLELTGAQALVDIARQQGYHDDSSYLPFVTSDDCMGTLSRASNTPITSQLLLESGLLSVIHNALNHLSNTLLGNSNSDSAVIYLSLRNLAKVLSFLAQCAEEPIIKDWFGQSGHAFWKPLLLVLGSGRLFGPAAAMSHASTTSSTQHRMAIESAAIRFFCKCITMHPSNQQLFAQLLCNVMETPCCFPGESSTTGAQLRGDTKGLGLSGFLRRLILEAFLQDEAIDVCVHSEAAITSLPPTPFSHGCEWHPRFGAGHNVMIVRAKLTSKVADLDDQAPPIASQSKPSDGDSGVEDDSSKTGELDDFAQFGDSDLLEGLSIAACMNVKSKRGKASSALKRLSSKKLEGSLLKPYPSIPMCRHHVLLGNSTIPGELSLSQLVHALMQRGLPPGTGCLELSRKSCGALTAHMADDKLVDTDPLPSALHIFASYRGLAILSSRLSCAVVMPQPTASIGGAQPHNQPVALPLAFSLPLFSLSRSVLSKIPGHSLAAFGLFICLPGYADVLLQDRSRAQCLLRLLLGAEDDGNGGSVLSSQTACSLPTLPFQILRLLYHSSPLSGMTGVALREASLHQGAVDLVLVCLGVLSHHEPRTLGQTDRLAIQTVAALTGNLLRGSDQNSGGEKQYWAKGTGFGTGSTTSDWDVENAMKKQQAEEAHVTCMLQVLAAFIRPSGAQKMESLAELDYSPEYPGSDGIPVSVADLLSRSCLIPTLASYLRNDSVLDMARHVPLYQAVLEVLRALATCPSLLSLLTPGGSGDIQQDDSTCLASLISKMKQCVDTYSRTLRSTSRATKRIKRDKKREKRDKPPRSPGAEPPKGDAQDNKDDADAEGLALLIPDIQATAQLIQDVIAHDIESHEPTAGKASAVDDGASLSNEEQYLAAMKPLQFDTCEIVPEDGSKLEFVVGYHFASALRSAVSSGDPGSPARARRLAQEISSLSTSLPLSSSSSVFVRCDEDRLDVMKVLITGPAETPYANGCFEFDVYFPQNYPEAPMQINFETTGHHTVRFNPNLYNDGKVCLSILNTWHGRPEEKWNAQTSSFLQVLVSTQSLILVAEPYFNEPGYERSRGTPSGQQNSQEYNANIRQACVRWAMLEQLRKPSACFKEVIQSHFYLKKDEILQQCEKWIKEVEALTLKNSGGRAVTHHFHSLKQHTAQLKLELEKLQPPQPHHSDEDSE